MSEYAFSLKRFFSFLSLARKEGLITSAMEQEWRGALMEFQLVLTPCESRDLRKVSSEALGKRYEDFIRENQIVTTPLLIQRYETSLENALGDFIAYTFNPINYRQYRREELASLTPQREAYIA